MNLSALSCFATCLFALGLTGAGAVQQHSATQAQTQAELDARAKHRAERYAFLESSQRKASDAITQVLRAWPKDQSASTEKPSVAVSAAFNDTGKWCQSPWSTASIDASANPPLLVVCPIALETYAEMSVAITVLTAQFLPRGLGHVPSPQEMTAAVDASGTPGDAILFYYVTRLADLYKSNSLIMRTPSHCPPENVAYQAFRRLPLEDCAALPDGKISKWLSEKIRQEDMAMLRAKASEAIYLAIVAHELGHLASHDAGATTAMDEEILADAFALRVLRGDPEKFYLAGEMLEQLNIAWVVFSQLHIKTLFPLPPHEQARANAFARQWRCVKRDDVKDPDLAKTLERYRLLKMQGIPKNFCKQKSN